MLSQKSFVEELRWRGLLQDISPGAEEQLAKTPTSGYIGFDPTSDSLHLGSLSQIITLMRFQKCGHKPIVLLGGATGMVGDPSGKSDERNLLDAQTLEKNLKGIKNQLEKFLDFQNSPSAAEMCNNYDWFREFSFLDFIREAGKHITVNYMMAKDSVQKRLTTGISFTEFSYQLVQGWDFYTLWKEKNCLLQMGGSDQWGNMTTGTEFIRRKAGGQAFALTTKLITKADGGKFGKTEEGNIWLDPAKTSPYKFYQFWLNVSDSDASDYLRFFTFLTQEAIEGEEKNHKIAPQERIMQKKLADLLTELVHGHESVKLAKDASGLLFNGNMETFRTLNENLFLEIFSGVPVFEVTPAALKSDSDILNLLCLHTQIFPSKGEARKLIQGGGLSINREKITDVTHVVLQEGLLNGKYLIVQKGKKNFFLIKVAF